MTRERETIVSGMTALWAVTLGLLVVTAPTVPAAERQNAAPTATRAQPSVRLRIVDAETDRPLPGALVRCAAGAADVTSDGRGEAFVADCHGDLDVSLDGYVSQRLGGPFGALVDVRLVAERRLSESVTVVGPAAGAAEAGVPAQIAVTRDELALLRSVTFDDPLRALQQLPGVATSDELRAELSVRGSPFRQVGLVLDEVKSRLLVHTVRGIEQTGSVALLNADLVDAATLTPGAGPQRFGNTVGAELAIRTRAGRSDGLHGRAMASAIAATGYVEGPLGSDRVTLLAGARRSYASWIVRRIDPDVSGTFEFTDAQARLDARLSSRQRLSAGVLAGASAYDERGRRTQANALDVGRNRTAMGTVAWQALVGSHWIVRQRGAAIASRYRNENPDGRPLDTGTEREWLSRSIVEWAPTPAFSVDGAVQAQRFASRGTSVVYDPSTRQVDSEVAHRGEQTIAGGHLHARWSLRPGATVAGGARIDRLQGRASFAGGWLQTQVALSPQLLLSAAAGRHGQAPDVLQRFGATGTPTLDFETARLLDVGLAWRPGQWTVALSAYHRRELKGLDTPDRQFRLEADGRVAGGDPRARWTNALRGEAHGVELLLRRHAAAGTEGVRWSGWAGYGYGRTEYAGAPDADFAGAFDQRHLLTVAAAVHLGTRWDASGTLRLATNWPYEGWFRDVGELILLSADRNDLRLPGYRRADVRLRRQVPLPRGRLLLFGEVINVTNARNLRQVAANVNVRTGIVTRLSERQLPIIPAVGIAYEF
jgi:hypothetical protein